jgi:hypothetical protein
MDKSDGRFGHLQKRISRLISALAPQQWNSKSFNRLMPPLFGAYAARRILRNYKLAAVTEQFEFACFH